MFLKTKYIFILLFITHFIVAQNGSNAVTDNNSSSTATSSHKFSFRPSVTLSAGMLSFYGDMYDKHFTTPSVSKIAYQLEIGHRITDYLDVNLFFLYGKLEAN